VSPLFENGDKSKINRSRASKARRRILRY